MSRNLKDWDELIDFLNKLDEKPSLSKQFKICNMDIITGKGNSDKDAINEQDTRIVPFCTYCQRLGKQVDNRLRS